MTVVARKAFVAVAVGVGLLVGGTPGSASAKPRTTTATYTTPGGVTGQYPQHFLQFPLPPPGLENEVVGGGMFNARGTENRFEVSAVDVTGRPVAFTLYWYDDLKKPNHVRVICGKTERPLPIVTKGVVHAIVTAGEGCPGTVSAPTRGTLTFTWTTAPKAKRSR